MITALVLPTVTSQWMPVNIGKVRRLRSYIHTGIQMCAQDRWTVKVHALLQANESNSKTSTTSMVYQ